VALTGGLALLALCGCAGEEGPGAERARPAAPAGGPIVHSPRNSAIEVVVGATGSPEQRILAAIYARALRAGGFRASVTGGLAGAADAHTALRNGSIDAYPEFSAVALAGLGGDPRPGGGVGRLRARLAGEGAVVLATAPAFRSPAVVLSGTAARRLDAKRISDLEDRAGELRLAGARGCERRRDCLPALRDVYGLRFRRFVGVRPDLLHEPLRKGEADAAIVTATDPHIARDGEVLLEDDGNAFPASRVAVAVREAVARSGGRALRRTLRRTGGALTVEVMQELNARVRFDERSPDQVAAGYLRGAGLIR
jgi:osmoprotectant transport system substrate-binding protein